MHFRKILLAAVLAAVLPAAILAAILPVVLPGIARAQRPFYQGKTIHLLVGYAPGGGSDVMCRVLAQHMASHIDGHPTIIVQNMEGGDGANAINYVAEVARPDGQTALCGTVNTLLQLLHDPALRVDINSFSWVVGVPDTQVAYVRADVTPPAHQPTDLFAITNLVIGGFRATSSKDIPERLALDALGLKYRYVTGINGEGAGRAALQQNFINFWMDAVGSYIAVSQPSLVKPGIVVPVFQSGLPDDHGDLTVRNPAVPDLPTVYELYQLKYGKPPSGIEWETFQDVLEVFSIAQRGIALSSKAPPEAVAALRASVPDLLTDAAFMSDARKVMGVEFTAYDGARVQQAFDRALNPPDAVKTFLIDYVAKGQALAGQ